MATTYTPYTRGSEWRRWDLHIHTPETKKNDQFRGATVEEKWGNYFDDINASTGEVSVIAQSDQIDQFIPEQTDLHFSWRRFEFSEVA
jgi:hypothetical protein